MNLYKIIIFILLFVPFHSFSESSSSCPQGNCHAPPIPPISMPEPCVGGECTPTYRTLPSIALRRKTERKQITEEEAEKLVQQGMAGIIHQEVPAGSDDLIGAPECGRGEKCRYVYCRYYCFELDRNGVANLSTRKLSKEPHKYENNESFKNPRKDLAGCFWEKR